MLKKLKSPELSNKEIENRLFNLSKDIEELTKIVRSLGADVDAKIFIVDLHIQELKKQVGKDILLKKIRKFFG